MADQIFVIGHKSPDTDSVIAAISYANLKNILEDTKRYVPAVAGNINKATEFVLHKFKVSKPAVLDNARDKRLVLVDHNEASQSVDGVEEAEIVEILDHHKMNFSYSEPIQIIIKPWGSSCSIIAQMYFDNNIKLNKDMAGIILSAILDDTVITKSPTCTAKDKEIIEKLTDLAGVADAASLGMDLFKAKSSVRDLSEAEIIKNDFKDYDFKAGKFGFGQLETVDLAEFEDREDALLAEMKQIRDQGNYHSVILFLTDIIKEGSKFLVSTIDQPSVEKALGAELKENRTYIKGIVSRKKQVVPKFSEVFDK